MLSDIVAEDEEWDESFLLEVDRIEAQARLEKEISMKRQFHTMECSLKHDTLPNFSAKSSWDPCWKCGNPVERYSTGSKTFGYRCSGHPWCSMKRALEKSGPVAIIEVVSSAKFLVLNSDLDNYGDSCFTDNDYVMILSLIDPSPYSEVKKSLDKSLREAQCTFLNCKVTNFSPNILAVLAFSIENRKIVYNILCSIKNIQLRLVPLTTCKVLSSPSVPENFIQNRMKRDLWESLLPFQKEGVEFAVKRGGRCLIADEMGTGKTIQALAIALYYQKEDWPLLVITPASVRAMWTEEVERWYPFLLPKDIHVITSGVDKLFKENPILRPKVTIISYHMLEKLKDSLGSWAWNVVIVDESHTLATATTELKDGPMTKTALQVIKRAKRRILLSGTPSLGKPFDMFNQIDAIYSGLLGADRLSFAQEYCGATKVLNPVTGHLQVSNTGSSYGEELHALLSHAVMIRRLKRDIMAQLPPLRRTLVRLEGRPEVLRGAIQAREKIANRSKNGVSTGMTPAQEEGLHKVSGAVDWIMEKLRASLNTGTKFVVFAHHVSVMDALINGIIGTPGGLEGVTAMPLRIDGHVEHRERVDRLNVFSTSSKHRLIVVSTTAGGQGLDMSAASVAVFVELPQQFSWLRQAEDRLHRRGQASCVNVYYLVLPSGSADSKHWLRMSRRLEMVSRVTNSNSAKEILEVHRLTEAVSIMDSVSDVRLALSSKKESTSISDDSDALSDSDIRDKMVADGTDVRFQNYESTLESERELLGFKDSANVFEKEEFLTFEVSKMTGRVHVHVGTLRPLGANFRPELLNRVLTGKKDAIRSVLHELPRRLCCWHRGIQQAVEFWIDYQQLPSRHKALLEGFLSKPPLNIIVKEIQSRCKNGRGLIMKRYASDADINPGDIMTNPVCETCCDLPSNLITSPPDKASFSERAVAFIDKNGSNKQYTQRVTYGGIPLCLVCSRQATCSTYPTAKIDMFCSSKCYKSYESKVSGSRLRQVVLERDGGICDICGLNVLNLVDTVRSLRLDADRHSMLLKLDPRFKLHSVLANRIVRNPIQGNAWHADHVLAVFEGGGQCNLDNLRTLCIICHASVTKQQVGDRAAARRNVRPNKIERNENATDVTIPFSTSVIIDCFNEPSALVVGSNRCLDIYNRDKSVFGIEKGLRESFKYTSLQEYDLRLGKEKCINFL